MLVAAPIAGWAAGERLPRGTLEAGGLVEAFNWPLALSVGVPIAAAGLVLCSVSQAIVALDRPMRLSDSERRKMRD